MYLKSDILFLVFHVVCGLHYDNAFLQTWEANHVSQRLTEPEAERSKVTKFGMTLEGPAARWHAKHLPGSFATFDALKVKFLRLFHRQVEKRELVG